MATKATDFLTYMDASRLIRPDGREAAIGEILDTIKGMVYDAPWTEGDTVGGHMVSYRTSLPTIYTRRANKGVRSSASSYASVVEAPESLEGWSKLDEKVADYGGNPAAKRTKEAHGFAEAMEQTFENRIIYGNSNVTPDQIDGLAVRYNSLTVGNQKRNILNVTPTAAGADQYSMWLVKWGPGMAYCWYPKGSMAGLQIVDHGKRPIEELDANSNVLHRVVYKEQWKWDIGFAMENWKAAVRLANIDKSVLLGGTPPDLLKYMRYALRLIAKGPGRTCFYCGPTVAAQIDEQAYTNVKGGGGLTYENVDAQRIMTFQGVPIKEMDILDTLEAIVT